MLSIVKKYAPLAAAVMVSACAQSNSQKPSQAPYGFISPEQRSRIQVELLGINPIQSEQITEAKKIDWEKINTTLVDKNWLPQVEECAVESTQEVSSYSMFSRTSQKSNTQTKFGAMFKRFGEEAKLDNPAGQKWLTIVRDNMSHLRPDVDEGLAIIAGIMLSIYQYNIEYSGCKIESQFEMFESNLKPEQFLNVRHGCCRDAAQLGIATIVALGSEPAIVFDPVDLMHVIPALLSDQPNGFQIKSGKYVRPFDTTLFRDLRKMKNTEEILANIKRAIEAGNEFVKYLFCSQNNRPRLIATHQGIVL
ncbi:MAG: hypothetical protein WC624_03475 [Candidatus Margulisiibacteriota bacterium]